MDLFGDSLSTSKRPRLDGSTPVLGAGEEKVGVNRRLFVTNPGKQGWEGFESGENVIRGIKKAWSGEGDPKEPKSLLDKYVACESRPVYRSLVSEILGEDGDIKWGWD